MEAATSDPRATLTVEPLDRTVEPLSDATPLTATEILYQNELRRGRLWVSLCCYFAGIGIGAAAISETAGGFARGLLAGSCGLLLIVSLIARWVISRQGQYSARAAAFYCYFSLLCLLPAYHFFGWFSPVLAVVCVGAVVFSMGHSLGAVAAFATATSTSHLAIGALTIAGIVPSVGIASVHIGDTVHAVLVLIGSQAIVASAFAIGRQLRAHALDGVERYGAAVRESTRREVLLEEAIDELHRMRKAGGRGRFTGVELGSFRLGYLIGCGAMGDVYGATHLQTGQAAAVKLLTSSPRDERAACRFEREIELAARLESPHIVRVLEHSAGPDAMPYLAMERLDGKTLSEELRGRLEIRDVTRMLHEVAIAVDAAHAAGIVHRDLKPQNIFHHQAGGEDLWKVLDFGVAKPVDAELTLTRAGLVGTPAFMSPEQASGRPVDHRSDVFALGCVGYRALTGRPAFFGTEVAEVLGRVRSEMPLRPSLAAALPPEVDLVLAIALAKEPDERFDSAGQLASALAQACDGNISPNLTARGEALLSRTPWLEPPG